MAKKIKQCIALEGASEPVCRVCMESEVEDWLKRRRPGLVPALKKKVNEFFTISTFSNDIKCVKCNKRLNICDYCFLEHIKKWIKEKHLRLLAEFRLFFDFKLVF